MCAPGSAIVTGIVATPASLSVLLSLLRSAPAPHRRVVSRLLRHVVPRVPAAAVSESMTLCRARLAVGPSNGVAFKLLGDAFTSQFGNAGSDSATSDNSQAALLM